MTKPEETILWGLHKITGFWKVLRTCRVENAEKWLDIFSNDESEKSIYSEFKVSKKRPIYKRKGK